MWHFVFSVRLMDAEMGCMYMWLVTEIGGWVMNLGGLAQAMTKPWELEIDERILLIDQKLSLVQFSSGVP